MKIACEADGYRESRSLSSTVNLVLCSDLTVLASSVKLDVIKKNDLHVIVHDREADEELDALDGIEIEYFADEHGSIDEDVKKSSKGDKIKKGGDKIIVNETKIKSKKAPKKPIVKVQAENVSDASEEENEIIERDD